MSAQVRIGNRETETIHTESPRTFPLTYVSQPYSRMCNQESKPSPTNTYLRSMSKDDPGVCG